MLVACDLPRLNGAQDRRLIQAAISSLCPTVRSARRSDVVQCRAAVLARRGLVVMLKQMVDKRRNDFSAEAITAALKRPKHYPVALVAELLAELKASGDYDRILAETVS
jgi:hypothetical protein